MSKFQEVAGSNCTMILMIHRQKDMGKNGPFRKLRNSLQGRNAMGMDCKIFFTLVFMCLAIVQSWATAQLPVSGTNEWPVCCLFAPDDHPTNILYQEHCESSYCGIKKGMTVAIVREECCEVQRELHFKPGTRCVSIVRNPKSCRLSESCRSLFRNSL